jgi:hypothetical protein
VGLVGVLFEPVQVRGISFSIFQINRNQNAEDMAKILDLHFSETAL